MSICLGIPARTRPGGSSECAWTRFLVFLSSSLCDRETHYSCSRREEMQKGRRGRTEWRRRPLLDLDSVACHSALALRETQTPGGAAAAAQHSILSDDSERQQADCNHIHARYTSSRHHRTLRCSLGASSLARSLPPSGGPKSLAWRLISAKSRVVADEGKQSVAPSRQEIVRNALDRYHPCAITCSWGLLWRLRLLVLAELQRQQHQQQPHTQGAPL